MEDKPIKTGLYWARKFYSKDWDHIINIKGKSPFLNYIGWNLNYPLHNSTKDNGLVGVDPTHFIFGNEIPRHLNINESIEVPEKPGVYWAFSTEYSEDFILTYITGSNPYMSCFTWNIYSNLKKQVLDANDLTYLVEVEKPKYERI